MKFFNFFFYLSLFLFIFSFQYRLPTDPDLGWRLRYGQEVIESGRAFSRDALTHTVVGTFMPDAEWLANGIFFFLFSHWSFFGVALVFGLLTTLAFFLPAAVFKGQLWVKFLLVSWSLIGTSFVLVAGARPQNLGWVFCGVFIILLLKYRESTKIRYLLLLPILFFVWFHSHPSFWLGIAVALLFATTEIFFVLIQGKTGTIKRLIPLVLVCVVSLLASFKLHFVSLQ